MKNLNLITKQEPLLAGHKIKIDYAGKNFTEIIYSNAFADYHINNNLSLQLLYNNLQNRSFIDLPDVLLLEVEDEACFLFIEDLKKLPMLKGIFIILLSKVDNPNWRKRALALKVDDYYVGSFAITDINKRINFLIKLRLINPLYKSEGIIENEKELLCKMPFSKRLFDIIASSVALILLSPLFVIIAAIIRLESKGDVIYRSKRVGTGYKIFDFYKFRSMRTGADAELAQLADQHNQYAGTSTEKDAAFIKIVNDPRITKIGSFIRNTSIDELPQLFNILIGDMSFVGNRPLPLYEAEMLTSNEWSTRFLGPAGLTGLWQISKRGKKDISELERKELDNDYVRQHSFLLDAKIILKTFPALVQSERV